MNIKKDIEDLIGGIDEFNEKYITYRAGTLRTILVDALDYIERKEQALDRIRQYRVAEINDEDEEETDTILRIIDGVQN